MTLQPAQQAIVERALDALPRPDPDDTHAIEYAVDLLLYGRPRKGGVREPLEPGDESLMLEVLRRRTPRPVEV